MKTRLLFLFVLTSMSIFAQCPPSGPITLTTQAEVNNFIAQYPNCTTIDGNFTLNGATIIDLTELNAITTINGALTIQSTSITNGAIFNNLTGITGTINFQSNLELTVLGGFNALVSTPATIQFVGNTNLTSVTGFSNLTTIGANLSFIGVGIPILTNNISGFSNLQSIGYLILRNTSLTNLNDFTSLTAINNGLSIDNNPLLTSITGLSSATNALGNGTQPFRIFNNPVLTSLDGINFSSISNVADVQIYNLPLVQNLDALTSLTGPFNLIRVSDMPQLTNLNGLVNIGSINALNIANNSLITALPNWNLSSVSFIQISNNPALTSIASLSGATSLIAQTGNIVLTINGNNSLTNLQGLQNIVNVNGFNININSNALLTDISALNNVNVSTIGFLSIGNNSNLSACNETWVCDLLALNDDLAFISNNAPSCSDNQTVITSCGPNPCPPNAVTLTTQAEVDAFVAQYPNCTSILGDFTIEGNTINNISGLINLNTVDGGLTIQNTALTSLNGFQNLNSINGIVISNNPNLTSIANLLQVNASVYEISISNNPQLTSLFGLNGITSTILLYLVDLPLVNTLQPLSSLGSSLPFAYIVNLPIQNLTGLNQVTTTNTFNLNNLPSLTSLQGLNQLTTIIFPSPRANDNDFPQEVLGFAYGLSITNTSISNLDELSNLTNMNGTNLSIVNNPNLISLTGLTNLIPTSVGYLEILNNALLSNCATATICSILENIDENSVFIEMNDTGCDSVIEVENACESLSTSDFNLTNDIQIYPNPFNNHISIALGSDYQNVKTTLVDVTGKQFYSKTFTGNTIEINQLDSLSSGMYFVTVELENGKTITQKIVK